MIDQPDVDEPFGQEVEQLGVGGGLAPGSEVAGGGHQSGAEVLVPDPIDQHPGGQRVVRAGDGLGEFEPAAPLGEGLGLAAGREHPEEPAGDLALPGRPGLPRM